MEIENWSSIFDDYSNSHLWAVVADDSFDSWVDVPVNEVQFIDGASSSKGNLFGLQKRSYNS